MTTITAKNAEATNIMILYSSALFIVFVLAYMDEGYYSFEWMADPGSWVAVALFSGALFLAEFLIYRMIIGIFNELPRLLVSITIGMTIVLAFLFLIVFPVLQS